MSDVCTTGDTAHIDTIFKLLPHTRQQLVIIIIIISVNNNNNNNNKLKG